jgi:hypothetical protein
MLPNRSYRLGLAFALTTALAAPVAPAGSLQKSRVAADAQWLAHIDVEGLISSDIAQFVINQAHDADAHFDVDLDELNGIKEQLGIDPFKDIKDVTVYGNGNPETEPTFIAIFSTTAAVDNFLESLKAQGPGYKQFEAGGLTVQSIDDEHGGTLFFHVQGGPTSEDRTIVVSKDAERLVRGVNLVQGKGANLAAAPNPALTHSPQPGSFMFAAAQGLPWMQGDEDDPSSALVRDAESLVFDAGAMGDETFMSMALTSKKAEDATNVADMVRGLLAMGKMAAGSEPELAPFKATINAVRITSEGDRVAINMRQKTSELIEALKSAAAADEDDEHAENGPDDQPNGAEDE